MLIILRREAVPSLTSDMDKKTISFLAQSVLLPQRANSGYILGIYPQSYFRSKFWAEAKIIVIWHVLSTWSK